MEAESRHENPSAKQKENLEARYEARLKAEVAKLQEQSQRAVEEFKKGFPPPNDEQIERLLYPELSEFEVEMGGQRFLLREMPALCEKKFLRLIEKKLPELAEEILSFDERLGDSPARAFGMLFTRAETALDLIAEACALVLDPTGDGRVSVGWVQQHASTARQLRILQGQLHLNGVRDFLLRLFPGLGATKKTENDMATQPPSSVG